MRKDTEIELSHGDDRKLSAFNIYYSSHDPKTAQRTTNEPGKSVHHRESGGAAKAFRGHNQLLGDQLLQARAKTGGPGSEDASVQDQHLGELPTQTQSNLQILAGLQTQAGRTKSAERPSSRTRIWNRWSNQYRAMGGSPKRAKAGQQTGLGDIDKQLDQLKAQLAT